MLALLKIESEFYLSLGNLILKVLETRNDLTLDDQDFWLKKMELIRETIKNNYRLADVLIRQQEAVFQGLDTNATVH